MTDNCQQIFKEWPYIAHLAESNKTLVAGERCYNNLFRILVKESASYI